MNIASWFNPNINPWYLRNLRISQWCCWRFKSFEKCTHCRPAGTIGTYSTDRPSRWRCYATSKYNYLPVHVVKNYIILEYSLYIFFQLACVYWTKCFMNCVWVTSILELFLSLALHFLSIFERRKNLCVLLLDRFVLVLQSKERKCIK